VVRSSYTGDRWIQDKRHPYTISIGEQRKYGLTSMFSELRDRNEAISIGDKLFIYEGKRGRYAILICEDFGRENETCELIRVSNCRYLIVLLMDGPVVPERWVVKKAGFFGDETGTHVIVANSLLLPSLDTRQRGEVPHYKEPVGMLIAAQARNNPSSPYYSVSASTNPHSGSLVSEALSINVRLTAY
jgi:hypothetical protein